MTPTSDIRACQFTTEEVRAVVEEAHRLGLAVTAHAHALTAVKAAPRAVVKGKLRLVGRQMTQMAGELIGGLGEPLTERTVTSSALPACFLCWAEMRAEALPAASGASCGVAAARSRRSGRGGQADGEGAARRSSSGRRPVPEHCLAQGFCFGVRGD